MRTFHFACQLAALAASVTALVAESKVTEIDTIIPAVNATYAPGENDRFPLVWAVRNPNQWQSGEAILSYSVEPSNPGALPSSGTIQLNAINTTNDVYYLTVNVIGEAGNDYNITWSVAGSVCNDTKGFGHSGQGHPYSFYHFSVQKGGQKADFSTAVKVSCDDRNGAAYNFGVDAKASCRVFDKDEPYDAGDPCGLKVADDAAAIVQKSLDDQLKQMCDNPPNGHICPTAASTNSTSTDKKNAAAAAQVSSGTLLLGLGLSVVAVTGSFLS